MFQDDSYAVLDAIAQRLLSPLMAVSDFMDGMVFRYGWWPVAAAIVLCLLFAAAFEYLPIIWGIYADNKNAGTTAEEKNHE